MPRAQPLSHHSVHCGRFRGLALALLLLLACLACGEGGNTPALDLILRGGTVVDGSGAAPRVADVGIRDGRIERIGDLDGASAEETLDVSGLIVAPGFIDVHSHADEGLVTEELKGNRGFLTQGVTTAVYGADGQYAPGTLRNLRQRFSEQGMGTHALFYVGHNGIRRAVLGMEAGPPSEEQLERMRELVREGMAEGAVGLSTGLMYLPGRYATTEEVIALAEAAAEAGGLYDSHVRDPANNLVASHAEAIQIGEESGARPHLGHIKSVGGKNFGKGPELVALVEGALERGVPVTADLYPYDGAATAQVASLFVPPPDLEVAALFREMQNQALVATQREELAQNIVQGLLEVFDDPAQRRRLRQSTETPPDGVYSWVDTVGYVSFRIVVTQREDWLERMVTDVAESEGISPFDVLAQLVELDGPRAKVTLGAIQEEDVRLVMQQRWAMIASDGALTGFEGGGGHPRHRGTFPRVLGRYVREWQVLTLEDAVRKMTSLPADYLQLEDRGRLAEGQWADITVFDAATIIDHATWEEPSLYSEGVVHVLLEGNFALRDEELTGELLGRDLRTP